MAHSQLIVIDFNRLKFHKKNFTNKNRNGKKKLVSPKGKHKYFVFASFTHNNNNFCRFLKTRIHTIHNRQTKPEIFTLDFNHTKTAHAFHDYTITLPRAQ